MPSKIQLILVKIYPGSIFRDIYFAVGISNRFCRLLVVLLLGSRHAEVALNLSQSHCAHTSARCLAWTRHQKKMHHHRHRQRMQALTVVCGEHMLIPSLRPHTCLQRADKILVTRAAFHFHIPSPVAMSSAAYTARANIFFRHSSLPTVYHVPHACMIVVTFMSLSTPGNASAARHPPRSR